MNRGLGSCLVVALFTLPVNHARAALLNGGFESGNFSDWVMNEDVYAQVFFGGTQVVTSRPGYLAYEGNYFAKMPVFSTVAQPATATALRC